MLEIRSGVGATALDIQQIFDAHQGWTVGVAEESDSCEVTIGSAAQRRLDANDGIVYLNGERAVFEADEISLDVPDQEDPRRDVIYVDSSGSLSVEAGEPNPYYPDPNEVVAGLGAWDVFSPFPHSMHDVEGTVLAEALVVPGGGLEVRDRRISAEHIVGELNATRGAVESAPSQPNDIVRLAELSNLTGDISDLTLSGDLNASNFHINNVGRLTANSITINSAPQSGNDAVRYSYLSNYYARNGDSLRGTMNANGHSIENADEVEGETITATGSLNIPVSDGVPDEGMLWWNTQES